MDTEEAKEFIRNRSRLLFTRDSSMGMVEAKEQFDKEQIVLETLYTEIKRLQEENAFLKSRIRKEYPP